MWIWLFLLTVVVAYLFLGGLWMLQRMHKHMEWHREHNPDVG